MNRLTLASDPSHPDGHDNRRPGLGLAMAWVVLCWGALSYHILNLTRQSLWPDEVYSLVVSGWTLGETWRELVSDHVPLYTVVLGGWRLFAGSSEFGLRYLSVVLATLSVPLVVSLARRFLDLPASYVSGVLLAISPFQLYYAQEIVTYAFLGVLVLLASKLFLNWAAHPTWGVVLLEGVLYAVIAYTHYSGLFFVATHVAIWCGSSVLHRLKPGASRSTLRACLPDVSRRWPVAWAVCGALFAPWFFTHLSFVAGGVGDGTSKSLLKLVSRALVDLTYGYAVGNHLDLANPTDAGVLGHLAWLSVVVPVCCALAVLPRRRAGRLATPAWNVVALLHVAIPFGLLLLAVQGSREFSSRYAFPATLWLPVVIVAGLWYLRAPFRWLGVLVLTGFSLWGGLVYLEHPGFARLDFRSASAYILNHFQPGDSVIVTAPYVASTFDYYSAAVGATASGMPVPPTVPGVESQTRSTVAALASENRRLWHLRWQDDYADPRGVILKSLQATAIRESQRDLGGGLVVDLWLTRQPTLARLPPSAHPAFGQLGDQAKLLGYEVTSEWPGTVAVTLFWSLSVATGHDYTVFLHLLDGSGHPVANGDRQPYAGQYPTTRWPTDEIVRDVHEMTIGPCTPAGTYQIETGMYLLQTMERLGSPGSDAIKLTIQLPEVVRGPTSGAFLARLPSALRLDERLPPGSGTDC